MFKWENKRVDPVRLESATSYLLSMLSSLITTLLLSLALALGPQEPAGAAMPVRLMAISWPVTMPASSRRPVWDPTERPPLPTHQTHQFPLLRVGFSTSLLLYFSLLRSTSLHFTKATGSITFTYTYTRFCVYLYHLSLCDSLWLFSTRTSIPPIHHLIHPLTAIKPSSRSISSLYSHKPTLLNLESSISVYHTTFQANSNSNTNSNSQFKLQLH